MTQTTLKSGILTLKTKKAYINPDGDIGLAKINVGDQTIYLTYPQANKLGEELIRRCQ